MKQNKQRWQGLHHHITRYEDENGKDIVVSWLQFNIFNKCYCFSKRRVVIDVVDRVDKELGKRLNISVPKTTNTSKCRKEITDSMIDGLKRGLR